MAIRNLEKFASYKDSMDFRDYLDSHGVDELEEQSGGVEGDIPTVVRLGGVVRSFREYHVDRIAEMDLKAISYEYCKGFPVELFIPTGAFWAGVLYLDDPRVGDFELMLATEVADSEINEPGMDSRLLIFWG